MRAVAPLRRTARDMGDRLFNVLGAIVTVALVTTIVSRPTSATVIRAMGDAFAGSIRAALGQ
jgi:hypothetical protein